MLLSKVEDPEMAARKIASTGPKIVVVKLGADGAYYIHGTRTK